MSPRAFLSGTKRDLVKQLLRERGMARSAPAPRRSVPGEPVSLYPNQAGLWFLDQLHPGRADFSIPASVRLQGELDVDALARASSEIVRRHHTLRTRFAAGDDGAPVQLVCPHEPTELDVTSLEHLAPETRLDEAARLASAEAQTPFDLTSGRLLRASVLRLAPQDHVLLLNLHHIVSDGWSMGVLTQELGELYQAFRAGEPSPLPALPLQFADYVLEEEQRLQGETLERHLDYWRSVVGTDREAPQLELPGERTGAADDAYRGKHLGFQVAADTTRALKRFAQKQGITLHAALMTAFKCVLHCGSGQTDIVVGTTFANRPRVELESLIGFFANTLPMRTKLADESTYGELAARVYDASLEAQEHQSLPFATLVSKLRPRERSADASPVYRVVFDVLTPDHNPAIYGYGMDCAIEDAQTLAGLRSSPLAVEGGVARFDVAVFVWDLGDELRGTFEYRVSSLESSAVERLARDLETLLALVASEPSSTLGALRTRLDRSKATSSAIHQDVRASVAGSLKRRRRKAIRETLS